ncbi:GNAT family N-acetyltransferase [Actinosynnema sp. NPDC020468]|uniref:GNAT family N-acetyltransferase n=1 Tax=Actinosynnema sp. NPDC020468 TaxID=3154488 RepID=UPI0033EA0AE2
MTDHDIRVLDESHYRAAHTLFRGTLHHQPSTDEAWAFAATSYLPGRTLGAFVDDDLVGTVMSFPSSLAVPGGAVVPMAAVSRVGVRADWTRRGVLSALKRAQLRAMVESGDVAATLRASETAIYGRYGYGVATRYRTVRVDRAKARPRLAPSGRIRLVPGADGVTTARSLFDRVSPGRPGTNGRWDGWWALSLSRQVGTDEELKVAVRRGPDGDDGYAVYRVAPGEFGGPGSRPTRMTVHDLWASTPEAWADLWTFLLGVDLVDEVVAPGRPLDEPLEWLLVDRRAVVTEGVEDETWLRLLDVPTALSARVHEGAGRVVLGVRDGVLAENEGSYAVTADGVERTADEPQLVVDVPVLSAAYLGDVTFSALATTGHLDVVDPAALAVADDLFRSAEIPWSGTFF